MARSKPVQRKEPAMDRYARRTTDRNGRSVHNLIYGESAVIPILSVFKGDFKAETTEASAMERVKEIQMLIQKYVSQPAIQGAFLYYSQHKSKDGEITYYCVHPKSRIISDVSVPGATTICYSPHLQIKHSESELRGFDVCFAKFSSKSPNLTGELQAHIRSHYEILASRKVGSLFIAATISPAFTKYITQQFSKKKRQPTISQMLGRVSERNKSSTAESQNLRSEGSAIREAPISDVPKENKTIEDASIDKLEVFLEKIMVKREPEDPLVVRQKRLLEKKLKAKKRREDKAKLRAEMEVRRQAKLKEDNCRDESNKIIEKCVAGVTNDFQGSINAELKGLSLSIHQLDKYSTSYQEVPINTIWDKCCHILQNNLPFFTFEMGNFDLANGLMVYTNFLTLSNDRNEHIPLLLSFLTNEQSQGKTFDRENWCIDQMMYPNFRDLRFISASVSDDEIPCFKDVPHIISLSRIIFDVTKEALDIFEESESLKNITLENKVNSRSEQNTSLLTGPIRNTANDIGTHSQKERKSFYDKIFSPYLTDDNNCYENKYYQKLFFPSVNLLVAKVRAISDSLSSKEIELVGVEETLTKFRYCPTQWSRTYTLLERFLKLKDRLIQLKGASSAPSIEAIDKEDFILAAKLTKILGVFCRLADIISTNLVSPLYYLDIIEIVEDHLESLDSVVPLSSNSKSFSSITNLFRARSTQGQQTFMKTFQRLNPDHYGSKNLTDSSLMEILSLLLRFLFTQEEMSLFQEEKLFGTQEAIKLLGASFYCFSRNLAKLFNQQKSNFLKNCNIKEEQIESSVGVSNNCKYYRVVDGETVYLEPCETLGVSIASFNAAIRADLLKTEPRWQLIYKIAASVNVSAMNSASVIPGITSMHNSSQVAELNRDMLTTYFCQAASNCTGAESLLKALHTSDPLRFKEQLNLL